MDVIFQEEYNQGDIQNIRIINITLSSVSLIGSMFVCFVYWFFKEIRTFPLELVVWLCFSNAMTNIASYINLDQDPKSISCTIQGFMQMTFDNAAMVWATMIGYTAYKTVVDYEYIQSNIKSLRVKFIILGYVLPLVISVTALILGYYGPSGAWCWLRTDEEDDNLRRHIEVFVWIAYGFSWFLIIANFYFILKAIFILQRNHNSEQEKIIVDKFSKKLRSYPIVMVLCILPATVNRFYTLFNSEKILLLYLQTIADSLQGFFFAIIFGLNPSIKEAIKELCNSIFRQKSHSYKSERSGNENEFVYNNNFDSFISNEDFYVKNNLKKISNGGNI